MKPDSEIWLIQADVAIRHETEVGEQIGGVVAIGIQASHHQVLAGRIACVYFRGTLAVHPQDLTELQKEKIRQFLSVFEGDCSIPQILFQIRVTILIKSAWCNGKTVGFDLRNHLHQPDCLNSFLERRGGPGWDTVQYRRHGQQFLSAGGIALRLGLFSCQRGVSLGQSQHSLTQFLLRLIKCQLFGVLWVLRL